MPDGTPSLPRWADRDTLARYISVRVDRLPKMVRDGLLPAPSLHLGPRSPRWDLRQVDAAFAPQAASAREPTLEEALHGAVEAIRQGRR